jgi:hypothetical protein
MATYLPHADLGIHADTHLGGAHLHSSALPQLLMPYLYGQVNADPHATTWIMVGGYLSTSLVLLALVGLFAPGRRGLKLVLSGWGLLVFARMYGQPPLLGHVLGVLPDMSRIQFYRYATAALELPVIVLAAIGVDDMITSPEHRRRMLWAGPAVIVVVLVGARFAQPTVHALGTGLHHRAFFHASLVWGAGVAAAVAAVALARRTSHRAALLTLLVAVDSLALFVVPELAAPRATRTDSGPVAYLSRHLGDQRFFTLGPIWPNYGSYFGLSELGVDDFPPKLYTSYVRARIDPAAAFTGFRSRLAPTREWELLHHLDGYRLAGVSYVLTTPQDPLPESRRTFRLVFRSPTSRIYRLAGAAPYLGARGCQVSSPDRESARVLCPHRALLIRRETWLTGWSAQLDGRPATIRRVGRLFQGVSVPAGAHRITFSFSPPGIEWGLLAALAGCALMLLPTLARLSVRRW